ncbi:hypothetical protein CONLIGDRAFT_683532 [Coniochaeta ligniaria NRRL 30616]|uniref:Uncharacterized protein n=1 Tax=Coniochaeta ligniaria NRRL 30616 TaxID=1408157 RepID=A0A1J7IGI7_9PEZI|nr:hypothetical protein CONLIGDRAFT_683532 [Coniochaeta ligniaria NRRL 30616]
MSADKRVCLAYSGGFDTSTSQVEDFAEVEKKALALGAAERMIIENLQQEFVVELI